MRIAIVGSRNLTVSMETLEKVLPWYTDEILSGGAKGIDSCARSEEHTFELQSRI